MRRTLSCVLMMTLLLTACQATSGGGEMSPDNLAAQIRAEYLNVTGWQSQVALRVDYGERVYDFTLDASWQKDGESVFTVVEPELIAGITARLSKDGGVLEYDGMSLSTGPISDGGMEPLEAVPFLMDELTQGYMASCSYETEGEARQLRVLCRDPDREEGTGPECALYFDPESHDLLWAELFWDGFTVLTARFNNFVKEMTTNDKGDSADLG